MNEEQLFALSDIASAIRGGERLENTIFQSYVDRLGLFRLMSLAHGFNYVAQSPKVYVLWHTFYNVHTNRDNVVFHTNHFDSDYEATLWASKIIEPLREIAREEEQKQKERQFSEEDFPF